jgi:DNA polymerase-3 subunit epsilon
MSSVFDEPMVFVDIETNGLNHVRGRVIEIAAIRVENGKVVRKLSTLLDPETELPYYITNLTGITTNDVVGQPLFGDVADELADILDGAIFVAHNVRFDYSFIKQEYKRLGRTFLPRQLCTVRLSRALFPEHRSHKLQSLIDRYGFDYSSRHRAYDDADILRQFMIYIRRNVATEIVEAAISKQLRQPAIPKHVDQDLVKDLPTGPGVYIFENESGQTLYIGKSINIKKRVLQHFGRDHDIVKEFKIAQSVKHIRTTQTPGELSALLLESRLIKEMQPVYNRQLRRLTKLTVAKQEQDEKGYIHVSLSEASPEEALTDGSTLATYARKGRAKQSLETLLRNHELCPKLLSLEKCSGACFWYQLNKCRGACIGREDIEAYNSRLLSAFGRQKISAWPFAGPVLVKETEDSGIVVDDWRVLAEVNQEPDCEPRVVSGDTSFDLDTYKILQQFIGETRTKVIVSPLSGAQLQQLGLA